MQEPPGPDEPADPHEHPQLHAHPELTTPREPQEPQEPAEPAGDLDLLTVGLVVFFVTLILIVGALLLLPAVF